MNTNDIPATNLSTGNYINSIGTNLLLSQTGKSLILNAPPTSEQSADTYLPRDADWIRQSFMIASPSKAGTLTTNYMDTDSARKIKNNRRFSSASLKYTDSSMGGNHCINPPPQYTRYADIRDPGIHTDSQKVSITPSKNYAALGMGRYYSEAIDDNNQIIHLRFGVASYNSLTQFFTGFYNGDLAAAARSGRFTDDLAKNFFSLAGNAIGLAISPLFIVPLAILLLGSAARYFLNMPSSKFYSLKPVMPVYWNAVTSLVNQLAVNSGLSTYVDTTASKQVLKGGDGADLGAASTMNSVGHFLPAGLFKPNGTIDVYAMANRSNRMNIDYQKKLSKAFAEAPGTSSYFDTIRTFVETSKTNIDSLKPRSLEDYLSSYIDAAFNKGKAKDDSFEQDPRNDGVMKDGSYDGTNAGGDGIIKYMLSNLNDGSEFASFRVDYTGPVSESFSNSVAESSLASKINSMSSSNRDIRINLADGNGVPGADMIVGAIKAVMGGVSQVLQIEGFAALAGSAFVDIPKHWDTSIANLPTSTYTMTLISPYGNPISRLFSIWTPLAMLLAGTLPLATGKQSHTSPYLCELIDTGRSITRLGIINALTITRGTSNLGFTKDGHALAIDVSFTVLDLSSIVAMPVQPGFSLSGTIASLFDSENAFTDYLMSLSALGLNDVTNKVPMLKYAAGRAAADMSSFFSASHFASYFASVPGVSLLSAAMRGTDKQ